MVEIKQTAVIGAGVIGASWTDPSPTVEQDVNDYLNRAWPTLIELSLAVEGCKGNLAFFDTAAKAVVGAQFIQENVPERIDIMEEPFKVYSRASF